MRLSLPPVAPRARKLSFADRQDASAAGPVAWLAVGSFDNSHSRRVALLKRVLPAVGVALVLAVAMWPRLAPLWERMRLALPAIDLREARELQMINPRYAGNDRQGRPFLVTAAVGRQVPGGQDLMSLERPRARFTNGGGIVVVTAATGIYQGQPQILDLFGDVTVTRQDGTRFVTDSARVDVAHGTAEGSDPVVGHGPAGDIRSAGFRILDKGGIVLFTGRSDALLKGAGLTRATRRPAAMPAPIAAAAAHAAAEAKPALAEAARAAHHHSARHHHAARHHHEARHHHADRHHHSVSRHRYQRRPVAHGRHRLAHRGRHKRD